MSTNQRGVSGNRVSTRTHHGPDAPRSPLVGCQPGDRCPRSHCGGLLILRAVETLAGACDEVVCSSCARSALLAIREPYAPMLSVRDPKLESLLTPDRPVHVAPGTDDMWDSAIPLDVLDDAGLRTGWSCESPLSTPPDTH